MTDEEQIAESTDKQIQMHVHRLFKEASISESDMPQYEGDEAYRETPTPELILNQSIGPINHLNRKSLRDLGTLNIETKHLLLQKNHSV